MKYILLAMATILPLTATAEDQHISRHIKPIEIEGAWARATLPSMRASAAYMVIRNNTDVEDCLIKAESQAVSEHTDLHTTTEDANGMLSMVHVDEMCVPPHGAVELSPGKFHIMFMRLTQQLKLGNEVPLTLTFKNAGTINTRAKIKSLKHTGKMMMHHDNAKGMHE